MSIASEFNLVANEYDGNRRRFVPCFEEFYNGATNFIAENISEPRKILDLGAGTGLLTKYWLEHFPTAEYILVDLAAGMLEIAAQRFSGNKNISIRVGDYLKEFPAENFDAIISALSIHHLGDADKFKLFAKIYGKLPSGGIFVNYDQFIGESATAESWYKKYWRRQLIESGLSRHDLELFAERVKLDRECTVAGECEMLRRVGFEVVQCVYTCQKFSVIVAAKEGDYQIDN